MSQMTDAILYVGDFASLAGYMADHYPECLVRDDEGEILDPPVITGFARTPAVVRDNAVLVYARLTDAQAEQWRGTPGVEILAESPYLGSGRATADAVYGALFDDPEALTLYDSVYDRSPREVDDGEGGTTTVTPSARFGAMA